MDPKNVVLFLQNLYSNNAGQNLVFEQRGKKLNQVVSPALSKVDAQSVCDNFKKFLPSLAEIELAESRQEKGKFRAVIYNPKEIFEEYLKKTKYLLNQHHPIPSFNDGNGNKINYFWIISGSTCLGYKTDLSSAYCTFNEEEEKIKENSIEQIQAYNSHLQTLYPGLQIAIEEHKHGDAYVIDNLTYENYRALHNKLSLRDLGVLFFKNEPNRYNQVKQILPDDIKVDIESHQM